MFALSRSDNDSDWPIEDCQTSPIGPCGTEARSLLRVWGGCPHAPHVYICADCSLVGLHMVCNWQCREALSGAHDWLVG